MAGASSEGEVNHWPAFVDVLTTVIMVVTFLLVIMSAAIMVLSQRAMQTIRNEMAQSKKIAAMEAASGKDRDTTQGKDEPPSAVAVSDGAGKNIVRSPVDAEQGSSISQLGAVLRSDVVNGTEKLTIRTRETEETLRLKVKALEDPEKSKGAEVTIADTLIRVDFEPVAMRYSDDNQKQIATYLKSHAKPAMKYEIWSFATEGTSVSAAQRIAFFRAAMTRNILIAAGIAPADINTQIRVADPASKDGNSVRVVLKP